MRPSITAILAISYQLVCVLTYIYVKTNGVTLHYMITSYGQCFAGNDRFGFFQTVSVGECVVECGLRSDCAALNFIEQINACELFSSDDFAVEQESKGKCVHVKKADIHDVQTPCANCNYGQACDTQSKTCRFKECVTFPSLEHGKVLGNRKEVGMTIRYMCDYGFKEKDGMRSAKCLDIGQWNQTAECVLDCKTGWIPFEGSCYLFTLTIKRTWTAAKDYCESEGSALVKVADNKTHQFIGEKLKNGSTMSWWTGGRYNKTKSGYIWLDGTGFGSGFGWGPEAITSIEKGCVLYYIQRGTNWQWEDASNDSCDSLNIHFICERKVIQS